MVKGYFVLGRAAIDAVKQWRFKPYTQNGKTMEFQTTITINFRSAR
jgi:periplasmic protein TonB